MDITQWKREHSRVFEVVISNIRFIYRRLTVGEYRDITRASHDDCQLEDNIVGEALLYPQEPTYESYPAGIYTTLSNCILVSSMLDSTDTWEDYIDDRVKELTPSVDRATGRTVTNDPVIPVVNTIIKAYPAYRPEELLALSVDELLDRYAWAQEFLGGIQPDKKTRNIPPAPPGVDRKQYLDQASMEASTRALREEMKQQEREARRDKNTSAGS